MQVEDGFPRQSGPWWFRGVDCTNPNTNRIRFFKQLSSNQTENGGEEE